MSTLVIILVLILLAAVGAGLVYYFCHKKLKAAKAIGDKMKLIPKVSAKTSFVKSKILRSSSKKKDQDIDVEKNSSLDSTDSFTEAESKANEEDEKLKAAVKSLNNWSISNTNEDGVPEDEYVGEITYSLQYDYGDQALVVKIISAKELTAMDVNGQSDPYVKIALLPDKNYKLESKVKRSTLNPKWNESFYFEGFSIQKLQSRTLHLHVYDHDRFSRDDSIGEVHIPLCQIDFSEKREFSKMLKPLKKNQRGVILTSLLYEPIKKEITINVIKCKNLMAMDLGGKSDPYLKIVVKFGNEVIVKEKTEHQKSNLNPVFNKSLTFPIPWEKLKVCQIHVMVVDYDRLNKNDVIGKVTFGKEGGSPSERTHYNEMITNPKEGQVKWHRLKPA